MIHSRFAASNRSFGPLGFEYRLEIIQRHQARSNELYLALGVDKEDGRQAVDAVIEGPCALAAYGEDGIVELFGGCEFLDHLGGVRRIWREGGQGEEIPFVLADGVGQF